MNDSQTYDDILSALRDSLKSVAPGVVINGADVKLLGEGAVLDSIAFLGFLMSAEEALGNRVDLSAALIARGDDDPDDSPFRSVESLASYIDQHRS